jgi:hypothetical protein
MTFFRKIVAWWLAYQRSGELSVRYDHPERPALPTGSWSAQGHSQWIVP